MRNIGNTAKLQVLVERLRQFWPEASIDIITYGPNLLKIYIPDSNPISPSGIQVVSKDLVWKERILQLLPKYLLRLLFESREKIWLNYPILQTWLRTGSTPQRKGLQFSNNGNIYSDNVIDYSEMIDGTDLFIATGCAINDVSMDSAFRVLYRLQTAIELGVTTIIVSPVVGPIDEPNLLSIAMTVLPSVDLIFARGE